MRRKCGRDEEGGERGAEEREKGDPHRRVGWGGRRDFGRERKR